MTTPSGTVGTLIRRALSLGAAIMVLLYVAALAMGPGGMTASAVRAAAPPPGEAWLDRLVAELGADAFATRETAMRALRAVGAEAVPALRRGMAHPDPEVRQRSLNLAREAEKRAAAFFEALGADVQWHGTDRQVDIVSYSQRDASRLRDEHLRELVGFPWLEKVFFGDAMYVGNSGVAHLGRLGKLVLLDLGGTQMTDARLAHLAGLTNLEVLGLHKTQVRGPGLIHLKGMKRLQTLFLDQSRLTDPGLAAGASGIKGLERLSDLGLSGTEVGDTGLAAATDVLKDLKGLRFLGLSGTCVSDAGLVCLGRLDQPIYLDLANTRITDLGATRLRALCNLRRLDLRRTAVTDAGCAHLARIRTLDKIVLDETRVTAAGLRLFKDLPRLKSLSILGVKLSDKEVKELHGLLSRRVFVTSDAFPYGRTGMAADKP